MFDGEGTITLSNEVVHVRIRNTDLELIERFHDIVRVGTVYGPYTRTDGDGHARKPVWDWVAREEDGLDALTIMWTWLSVRRREQARDVTGIVFTCFEQAAIQLRAQELLPLPPRPGAGV